MTAGCDPSVFATEIAEYIARAAEHKDRGRRTARARRHGNRGRKVRDRSNAPATDEPPAAASSSSYWDWDSAPASVSAPPPVVAEHRRDRAKTVASPAIRRGRTRGTSDQPSRPDAPARSASPEAADQRAVEELAGAGRVDPVAVAALQAGAPDGGRHGRRRRDRRAVREEIDLSGLLDDDRPPARDGGRARDLHAGGGLVRRVGFRTSADAIAGGRRSTSSLLRSTRCARISIDFAPTVNPWKWR